LWNKATSNSHSKSARKGSERRPNSITLQSSTTPDEQRGNASQRGGKLFPAMRISRKETPISPRAEEFEQMSGLHLLTMAEYGRGVHPRLAGNSVRLLHLGDKLKEL
jgi:hypothetical protein